MVHWHGLQIPPEVDGSHEEGTPMVQGMDRRRYTFTPQPAGTRCYHAHAMAGTNLSRDTYSGQFSMAIIEGPNPGRYDTEVPILLHEWDPFFSTDMMNDIEYKTFSITGKMLGAGEPLRVKTDPFPVKPGVRNRLVFDNRCDMSHTVHLHRHTFEITRFAGRQTSAVFKDLLLMPKRSIVEVDPMANAPGPSLFHCTNSSTWITISWV